MSTERIIIKENPMFAGTLTAKSAKQITIFEGTIHSQRFDIDIKLAPIARVSERSPNFEITAVNRAGRTVRIGSGWTQDSKTTGNRYISMQMDVGLGPFRVNAVQNDEARAAKSDQFEIIPLIANTAMPSGSMSGALTVMDADDAFAGHVANLMFDLDFTLLPNAYKTKDAHPDYRIEVASPNGTAIRAGSAWRATSETTGNAYISLLINTPDGDLRLNAVQNDDQRGGAVFAIIPFIEAGAQERATGVGLGLVA